MFIQTVDLTMIYQQGDVQIRAVDGISLEVEKGEFIAITGPSGSGKTTLLHLIGLLETPTSGKIIFDGEDASKLSNRQRAEWRLKRIGFVFQLFNLIPYLTALENVIIPRWKSGSTKKESLEIGRELLEKIGMGHRLHHPAGTLSAGEQQRVAIARAIINSPSILLADEPTGNLDSKNSAEILDLFAQLNRDGQTIMMITHEEEQAHKAGWVIALRDGKIQ